MLGNTITRAMTVCGNARVILINSREMVDDAIRVHHLSPTAAAALGRTLTAASMIGVMLKNKDDSVTVSFNGDGVCGKILAVADYYGNTKGYVEHPQADLPLNSKGKLDVAGAGRKGNALCCARRRRKRAVCRHDAYRFRRDRRGYHRLLCPQ